MAGTEADPTADEAKQGLGPCQVPDRGNDEYLEAMVFDATDEVLRDGAEQDLGFDLRHRF